MRDTSSEYEIWAFSPSRPSLENHFRVAAGLDAQTAADIVKRLETRVIISKIPDFRVYTRTPRDITYRIRAGDRIVCTRYNRHDAYSMYEKYQKGAATLRKYGMSLSMSTINNNLSRSLRIDDAFLREHLADDPVYGSRPFPPIVDPPDTYFGIVRTVSTYADVVALLAGVNHREIARGLRRIPRMRYDFVLRMCIAYETQNMT